MARGINKVILVGNLGGDPEVRYMSSGNAVTNVTLATSANWKDKNTGQQQERTEWHRVIFFNKLAEIAGEYLRKGSQIYVEGALRTRKWQDQSGQDKYTTEIVASEMQMLGGKQDGQQRAPNQSNSQGYTSNGQQYGQQPAAQQRQPDHSQPQQGYQVPGAGHGPDVPDWDDDIPFAPYHKHLII